MIDSEAVMAIFMNCLFKKEELEDGQPKEGELVKAEGIMHTIGFHPQRLEANRESVASMLAELPDEFHEGKGGGWSFLNACRTKNGEQWTDFQQRMDQLFTLGVGLGMVEFLLPREDWKMLPGGMPYVLIKKESGGDPQTERSE